MADQPAIAAQNGFEFLAACLGHIVVIGQIDQLPRDIRQKPAHMGKYFIADHRLAPPRQHEGEHRGQARKCVFFLRQFTAQG